MMIEKFNFYKSLKSFFFMSNVMGLFPFQFDSKNMKLKFSFIWFGYSIIILTIPFFMIYLQNEYGDILSTYEEIRVLISFSLSFLLLFQSIYQLLKGKDIVRILESLQNFDEKALKLGIIINYKDNGIKLILMSLSMILLIVYNIVILIVNSYVNINLRNYFEFQLCKSYQLIHLYFHSINFYIFLWIIKKRFCKLNKYLKFLLNSDSHHETCNLKLKSFFQLYFMLCKVVKEFNRTFTLNISITLLHILLKVIFTIYRFMFMIFEKNYDFIYSKTCTISWIFVHMIAAILICQSGASLTLEAEKCDEMILNRIANSNNPFANDELNNCYNKIRNFDRKIQNAFFVINWKLLLRVSD